MSLKITELQKIADIPRLRNKIDKYIKKSKNEVENADDCDCNFDYPMIDYVYFEILDGFRDKAEKWSKKYGVEKDLIFMYAGLDTYFQPAIIKHCKLGEFKAPKISKKLYKNLDKYDKDVLGNVIKKTYSYNLVELADYIEGNFHLLPANTQKFIVKNVEG